MLDVWYPRPELVAVDGDGTAPSADPGLETPAAHRCPQAAAAGSRADRHRLTGDTANRHRRRLPPVAPAVAPARRAPHRSTWTRSLRYCRTTPGRRSDRSPPTTSSSPGARLLADGERLQVFGVDKFPRMTDYVVPSGVRIADADRVRLGAHLAPGHHRHARGLLQLQRRDARHLDGRGPDLPGGHRRRRQRHRRRRIDHGHAVRWRQPCRSPSVSAA